MRKFCKVKRNFEKGRKGLNGANGIRNLGLTEIQYPIIISTIE